MVKYEYSISADFPNGAINISKLINEIQSSSIITALDHVDRIGDLLQIWFKAELSSQDKTILDGNIISPAGGLIALHDNTPSVSISQVEVSNIPQVETVKPNSITNSRVYIFTIDFCKKETWYEGSVFVENEIIGTGDSISTTFNFSHGASGLGEAIIDLCHSKVTDEYLIKNPSGIVGGFVPTIKISGIIKQEREMFETTGGDYEIDYLAGQIEFFTPPSSGSEIRSNYYYSASGAGPILKVAPPSGKKWIFDFAEAQFSSDFVMNDTILQNVFFNHPLYGEIPVSNNAVYAKMGNFLDYTYGSFPIIPALGGSIRGSNNSTIILRWNYLTPIELKYSQGVYLKSWTKHGRGFGGERATVAIYGLETNE